MRRRASGSGGGNRAGFSPGEQRSFFGGCGERTGGEGWPRKLRRARETSAVNLDRSPQQISFFAEDPQQGRGGGDVLKNVARQGRRARASGRRCGEVGFTVKVANDDSLSHWPLRSEGQLSGLPRGGG